MMIMELPFIVRVQNPQICTDFVHRKSTLPPKKDNTRAQTYLHVREFYFHFDFLHMLLIFYIYFIESFNSSTQMFIKKLST